MVVSRIEAAAGLRSVIAAITLVLAVGSWSGTAFAEPGWGELSGGQQKILAPLAGEWNELEDWRRKKWLDIAAKYPAMSPEEQVRVQRRMKAWVRLTPEERRAARETYRNVQKASTEEREALKKMWTEYQSLPPEQKQRFQQSAAGKPQAAGATSSDAALAARPRSPGDSRTSQQ